MSAQKVVSLALILATLILGGCERLRPSSNGIAATETEVVEQVVPQVAATTAPIQVAVDPTPAPEPTDVIVNLPTSDLDIRFETPPTEWDSLPQWLAAAWLDDRSRDETAAMLASADWLIDAGPLPENGVAGSFAQADINSDGLDEWIISVKQPNAASHTPTIPFLRAYPGNFYVIGQAGVLYQHYRTTTIATSTAAPFLLSLDDFSGDGVPDLIIDELSHNGVQYFGRFYFLTSLNGVLRDQSSAELKQVRPQPQLTVSALNDRLTANLRVRYADSPSATNGYWQRETYAWNGSTLARQSFQVESPSNADSLANYLSAQWSDQTNAARVRANLLSWGWLRNEQDWVTGDFDGDFADDWAVIVSDPAAEPSSSGYVADVWVFSAAGLFRLSESSAENTLLPAEHQIQRVQDLTNDIHPELLVKQTSCGAATCFDKYRIISSVNGVLSNIVRNNAPSTVNAGDAGNLSDAPDAISQTFSEISIAASADQPTPLLRVHGGTFGSVGAGVMRSYASYWTWSESERSIGFVRNEFDATNFRHLLLYEANELTASSDGIRQAAGMQLYLRIVNDTDLRDPEPLFDAEPGPAAAAEQFAAFRLLYVALSQGNLEGANIWIGFLEGAYTDAAMTLGARAMYDAIIVGGSPQAGCAAALSVMAGYENPVGALRDLGYGNPSLSSTDLCTP